jgi:hypothetical protein
MSRAEPRTSIARHLVRRIYRAVRRSTTVEYDKHEKTQVADADVRRWLRRAREWRIGLDDLEAIGSGMTIFREPARKVPLTLTGATSFECGIVALSYAPLAS